MTDDAGKKIPMVSVFMPAYNQEHVIAESINSVVQQNYDDWELVIGDDCSTDSTYQIALEYQQKFPGKIKVYRNEVNLGITENCNALLKKCCGKYISFAAGDDLYLPEKLRNQVKLMEARKDSVISYHDIEVFDHETNSTIKFWNSGCGGNRPIIGSTDNIAASLVELGTRFMAALSVMVRRDAIPDHGFDSRISISSDWLMWIEICANNKGEVLYIDEVMARYRKSPSGVTANPQRYEIERYLIMAIVEYRYPALIKSVRRARGYIYYERGVRLINSDNYNEGIQILTAGARMSIYSFKFLGWLLYGLVSKVNRR